MTTAAAIVIVAESSHPDVAVSTWPNARICADAHRIDVGTMTTTIAFSKAAP